MAEVQQAAPPPGKYLVDSYEDWARGEGIPILAGAVIDLLAIEPRPWPRFETKAAFCHLAGRDDFLSVLLLELAPGARSAPQRHLFEAVGYVLAGSGALELELGAKPHRVEWGSDSLVAVPMNARYRLHNDGSTAARIVLFSDLRYLLNLYRSERFLFGTEMDFPEREAAELVARDISTQPLAIGENRRRFDLASGSIGLDTFHLAGQSYRLARRQMQGTHLLGLTGAGYSLLGAERPEELASAERVAWRRGTLFAAPGMRFVQHFNSGAAPARYLDIQFGSARYPLFRSRRAAYGDRTVYAAGQAEIQHEAEDPRIREEFAAACRR